MQVGGIQYPIVYNIKSIQIVLKSMIDFSCSNNNGTEYLVSRKIAEVLPSAFLDHMASASQGALPLGKQMWKVNIKVFID